MTQSDTQPSLSIIVPMLNEMAQLPALLVHLKQWQQRQCEVILVDGGSHDGSANAALAGGFTVIQAPCGRARQMNAGAAASSGDVLLFLHADTRLPDDMLAMLHRALVSGRAWGRFDVRIEGASWQLPMVAWLMNLRSRWSGIATGDQAIFVSRTAFQAIGGFPDQPLMEDIELSKRLKRISAPACVQMKVTTSGRRWIERGAWRTIWLMWRLRWAYWRGVPATILARRYQ